MVAAPLLRAAEPAPPAPAEPPTVEQRLAAMETRIQLLERAMVEKDARIAELQRQLGVRTPAAGPQAAPKAEDRGYTLQMNPRDALEFQRRLEEYMRRNLDNMFDDGNGFGGMGDDMPLPPGVQRDPGGTAWAPRTSRKARLGVILADATPELREKYGNDGAMGVFVTQVLPDTPADRAGLKEGDCISVIDRMPVKTMQELSTVIRAAPDGTHRLTIQRKGQKSEIAIELGAGFDVDPAGQNGDLQREERWLRDREAPGAEANGRWQEEVRVRTSALELGEELAKELKLDEKQAAKMREILDEESKKLNEAYAGGLLRGDGEITKRIERHASVAEDKLRDVLNKDQMEAWRAYRDRHMSYSLLRQRTLRQAPANEDAMRF
ncbi:MAG: PDZ domain-containing protein [Planctomycetes bacterium]|nr:PDZ domain-containing protein [Planctomycetota bacterium]